MMPTAIVLPAAVPPGILGVTIDPSIVMAILGGLAAAVVAGLCIAIARQSSVRPTKQAVALSDRLAA